MTDDATDDVSGGDPVRVGTMRRLLLALVAFGAVGLEVELLLLDHADSVTKWIPHALLGLTLLACGWVAARPSRASLGTFRAVMAACVVAGGLGLYFHYRGNTEFELERDPTLRGLSLLWKSMRGATPALAPGALSQLGLMGLLYAWRHPANHESRVGRERARP